MKRIDENKVLPGDILLVTSSQFVSKAIRARTKSEISHAMICVDHSSVIDATNGEGVQADNLQRMLFDDGDRIVHLRARPPLDETETAAAIAYARASVGTRYSKRQAVLTQSPVRKSNRRQFCSRLVAQAYAAAGRKLNSDPDFCSPEDLRQSGGLFELPDPTRGVSPEELAQLRARFNPLEAMRDAHNAVLNAAREFDSRVEDFTDLARLVADRPEIDDAIAEAHRASGFLDLWRYEVGLHPERYDLAVMTAMVGADGPLEHYCRKTIANADEGRRWRHNLAQYEELDARSPRTTFALLADLYRTLADLHDRRLEVARGWLAVKGLSAR